MKKSLLFFLIVALFFCGVSFSGEFNESPPSSKWRYDRSTNTVSPRHSGASVQVSGPVEGNIVPRYQTESELSGITLEEGELATASDSRNSYVGTSGGNKLSNNGGVITYAGLGNSTDIPKWALGRVVFGDATRTWTLTDLAATDTDVLGVETCFISFSTSVLTINGDGLGMSLDDGTDASPQWVSSGTAGEVLCLTIMTVASGFEIWVVTNRIGTWTQGTH